MTTLELKKILLHRISQIDDISILTTINNFVGSISTDILTLTDKQKVEITAARKEVEQGLTIGHEELENEIKEWLKRKNV